MFAKTTLLRRQFTPGLVFGVLSLSLAPTNDAQPYDGPLFPGQLLDVGDSWPGVHDPRSAAIEDLDGDGDRDLAVANGAVSVLLNNGHGTFSSHVDYDAGGSVASLAVEAYGGGQRRLCRYGQLHNWHELKEEEAHHEGPGERLAPQPRFRSVLVPRWCDVASGLTLG